jgi:predicted HTH transcriptional regulator
LANAVYFAGYIERVGTGTCDIVDYCKQAGLPSPEFIEDEDFRVTIWRKGNTSAESENLHTVNGELHTVNGELHTVKLSKKQKMVLEFCSSPRTSAEIFKCLGISKQSRAYHTYINFLIQIEMLRPIGKGKKNDPTRKYVSVKLSQQ